MSAVISGYEVARLGLGRDKNPFPPGSDAWADWEKGYEKWHEENDPLPIEISS